MMIRRWQWTAKPSLTRIRRNEKEDITLILDTRRHSKDFGTTDKKVPRCKENNCEFILESSTRTRISFELASDVSRQNVVNFAASGSSVIKVRHWRTARNIEAMKIDMLYPASHQASALSTRVVKAMWSMLRWSAWASYASAARYDDTTRKHGSLEGYVSVSLVTFYTAASHFQILWIKTMVQKYQCVVRQHLFLGTSKILAYVYIID